VTRWCSSHAALIAVISGAVVILLTAMAVLVDENLTQTVGVILIVSVGAAYLVGDVGAWLERRKQRDGRRT
jgi:nitrate reductase gamma subunit